MRGGGGGLWGGGGGGGGGGLPKERFWDFYSLSVVLFLKIYYYDWNVTDFRKTVETGVDLRL